MRFIGTQFQTVDPKGRIVLPARFKRLLTPEDQDLLVMMLGREPCLVLHPQSAWARFAESLEARPRGEEQREAVRSISDYTTELELDANGRLTIPRDFLELVGIEREVAIVGQLRYIEVWSRANYEKGKEKRRAASTQILNDIL